MIDSLTAQDRLKEKHGNKYVMTNYINISSYADFECTICGYVWKAIAKSVITAGNGCERCSYIQRGKAQAHSYSFVKEHIESFDYCVLTEQYLNSKEKLKIKCPKGHELLMSFDAFKRGERCSKCQKAIQSLSLRVPEKIEKLIQDSNFEFIEYPDEYINKKSYIEYKCSLGHINHKKICEFLRSPSCTECTKIKSSESQRGSRGNNWKGGTSNLIKKIKPLMKDWKASSMKQCNYKCVVSGRHFDDIHHLYSFNLILKQAIVELGLNYRTKLGDYTDEDLIKITNKCIDLHNEYPLGICLSHNVHILFHKLYGKGNNTPEQFYEFQNRIESGEIVLE